MDDVYVNAGDDYDTNLYPATEYQKSDEEKVADGNKAASYPVMTDNYVWFSEQVAKARDISNIQVNVQQIAGTKVERKVSIEAQVMAYQMLAELLEEKANEYKDFAPDEDA